MNIGLDDFVTHFLSDDAKTSIASHHEASGDLDVKVTKWEDNGESIKKRFVNYNHPISIPLAIAPPTGAATKTQRMQRFGDHGVCVETETWINDIPLASCFYVADRLLVSADPDKDGEISLTIKFGICFVKRTMFKGIIASTSIHDVNEFQRGFIEIIQRKMENLQRSTLIREPSFDRNSREMLLSSNRSVTVVGPRGGSKASAFDIKMWLIIFLFLVVAWEHQYFTKRLHENTEKLERLENIFLYCAPDPEIFYE